MRRIMSISLALLMFAPLFADAATPVVNSGTINYSTNQITLTGNNFQPNKAKPTVSFNGVSLTVSSSSNTQVVATLPSGLTPGTFDLTVTNSGGNSVEFNMTYGAIGPQGPAGPTGAVGPQGPAGATGAQGPRGLTGSPGAPGPAGANGIGFTFLNAYDAYSSYAANSVVTYKGSSYIATVATGPNPNGPDPDQNPSWSLMAAVGAAGPAGPQGVQGLMGPTGPAGVTGPAGATGPAGPAGPRGATGAAGPAGANGTSFTFLNAYNAYATYAANNVVSYNGSSYIALVANGPNPNGPTPDQSQNWSLMAAAGGPGAAGPAGPQGPAGLQGPIGPAGPAGPTGATGAQGPAGSPGPQGATGPAGPTGPQGPPGTGGGTLGYAGTNLFQQQTPLAPQSPTAVASITLPNAGTYVIWSKVLMVAVDENSNFIQMTTPSCFLTGPGFDDEWGSLIVNATYGGTLSDQVISVNAQAGDVVTLKCSYASLVNPDNNPNEGVLAVGPVLSAIQVQ